MQNLVKQLDSILATWGNDNFITESDQNDVRRDLSKLRAQLAATPAQLADAELAELDLLMRVADPRPCYIYDDSDGVNTALYLSPDPSGKNEAGEYTDFASFTSVADANLVQALYAKLPGLLARLAAAEAPKAAIGEASNDEHALAALGFRRFAEWDYQHKRYSDNAITSTTEHYRLDVSGLIFRAYVERNNGPVYARLAVVDDAGVAQGGKFSSWMDCVSKGSIARKVFAALTPAATPTVKGGQPNA